MDQDGTCLPDQTVLHIKPMSVEDRVTSRQFTVSMAKIRFLHRIRCRI